MIEFSRTFVGLALKISIFNLLTVLPIDSAAQQRFIIGVDGSEVTDMRTGLVWRRCSEGQSLTGGVCVGRPTGFTHAFAMSHAKGQSGWRLPNVKELASIADDSQSGVAIDPVAFPNTPSSAFWTSSPKWVDHVWLVGFGTNGAISVGFTDNLWLGTYHVRLVR